MDISLQLEKELTLLWSGLGSEYTAKKLWSLLSMAKRYVLYGDTEVIKHLSANSHFHDNGFMKLTLFDTADRSFRIRLHIWNTDVKEFNIHDHRYDFCSLIISGAIENQRWHLSDLGTSVKLFQYNPRNKNDEYQLERKGQAFLEPQAPEILRAGDWYRMDSNELHTAKAITSGPVITMCLQDRRSLKPHAHTYSAFHPDEVKSIVAPSFSPEQYLASLQDSLVSVHESIAWI